MGLATARDLVAGKLKSLPRRIAQRYAAVVGKQERETYPAADDMPLAMRSSLSVAVLLIAVIFVLGLLLRPDQHLASLLVAPPTITAAACGLPATAAVATVCCGLALVLDALDGSWYTSIPAIHVITIVFVTIFVTALRGVRDRSLRELIEVRAVSEAVQRILLRPLPERMGDVRIASVYHSAQPWANLGGDLYAAARTANSIRFVIGDVRGKGLAAVDDAEALLGGFREAAPRAADLPALAAYLEESMENHFEHAGETDESAAERFVTALFLEISDDAGDNTRTVRTVNCGHYPPLLVGRSTAGLSYPSRESPPLGLNSRNRDDYDVEQFRLGSGEMLLLYTDGVVEARDASGAFYDLYANVGQWATQQPDRLLSDLLDSLRAHTGGSLDDDVAMVALRREGSAAQSSGV
ncbi:PP2C family protein-serine/threonine phosphatase [Streptomyces sp. NPDC049040]|uniref:PP2C family protein-serine/threonine phosphatase n=1 Tax=Streptomyces sp. NPDC049040 TaxID=3365593 RepID=UPI00371D672F